MTPINKTYKRILWSILIGGIFSEGIRDKSQTDNENPGMLFIVTVVAYIALTLIYNRYIWKTAKATDEEMEDEEIDFDWEEEE